MVMTPMAAAPGKGAAGKTVRVGDWTCPACGNHNYASREACNKCGAPKTESAVQASTNKAMRAGDWMCPNCGNHNFASREECNKCATPRPEELTSTYGPVGGASKQPVVSPYILPGSAGGAAPTAFAGGAAPQMMKEGDWICPACSNHNYATRVECNKCGTVREGFRKGDWICKACKNHNYANKMQCNKCGAPRNDGVMIAGMQQGMMMMPMMGCMGAQMAQMQNPMGMGGTAARGRVGDWSCPQCGNHNYAQRTVCNRCGAPKPGGMASLQQVPGQMMQQGPTPSASPGFGGKGGSNMRPGDWVCRACNNHNYASRESCNKCGSPKEADQ